MIRICTVCGQGLGSSLIIEMNVKNIISQLGLTEKEVEVTHKNLNSYSASDAYDYVIVGVDLANSIDAGKGEKIILQNLLDSTELKSVLAQKLKK